ncbi:aldehyde dehydrogenase iron-sulfur subunit PaoA [Massilia sp. CMS3.1]|uniref:aldehyde dehydrogenase iron-sulfur subunit PaoA n=1 Tax=Massilia sp. CMS3.1 TaxID=3373083 RepID=UPI003EE72FE2
MDDTGDIKISRRDLLITGALSASALAAPIPALHAQESVPASTPPPVAFKLSLRVNGQRHDLVLDTRTTLLDALREHLHLTGTKKGCDHGQCGACTLIANGERINSCLTLALQNDGMEITTIEGLGNKDRLHPMQSAFIKHDGYQCGYCTPGQICSAVSALREIEQNIPSLVTADLSARPKVSPEEIRERMSGNICRCGAYSNIIDAITEVAGRTA